MQQTTEHWSHDKACQYIVGVDRDVHMIRCGVSFLQAPAKERMERLTLALIADDGVLALLLREEEIRRALASLSAAYPTVAASVLDKVIAIEIGRSRYDQTLLLRQDSHGVSLIKLFLQPLLPLPLPTQREEGALSRFLGRYSDHKHHIGRGWKRLFSDCAPVLQLIFELFLRHGEAAWPLLSNEQRRSTVLAAFFVRYIQPLYTVDRYHQQSLRDACRSLVEEICQGKHNCLLDSLLRDKKPYPPIDTVEKVQLENKWAAVLLRYHSSSPYRKEGVHWLPTWNRTSISNVMTHALQNSEPIPCLEAGLSRERRYVLGWSTEELCQELPHLSLFLREHCVQGRDLGLLTQEECQALWGERINSCHLLVLDAGPPSKWRNIHVLVWLALEQYDHLIPLFREKQLTGTDVMSCTVPQMRLLGPSCYRDLLIPQLLNQLEDNYS
jgi:hypothetical protein